jgi:putative SOS response-associated peptidase YedK
MCGRFVLYALAADVAEEFDVAETPGIQPRYNIAPTQEVMIVRSAAESGVRELVSVRWGLIPHWAKDDKMAARMINARCETIADKPAFRAAFKYRRCLIPTNGFYEWKKERTGKQPFFFGITGDKIFAFGGIWERWKSPDGREMESCSILTTESNELLKDIHDRMPLILKPEDYALWLDPQVKSADALTKLFEPFPSEFMSGRPVSPRVNSPSYDGPDCVDPIPV